MASLFGKNKLREIASKLDTAILRDKLAIVKTWQHDFHNGSLKKDKETSREQAYNHDFFVKVLGYKEKPAVPYSFEPKATTEKGQLPDAVIGYTDPTKDIANIAAIIELKGALVELDRPQRREGNMSPVQQGFKYKTQFRNCPFVIVSNFWEFRLYHDNQLDYELWTLDDLVDPGDDYLKFKMFYTLIHSDNLTVSRGFSKTEGLLSDIRSEQEEIGKKFYKVYHQARLDLLRDIYRGNEYIKRNIDTGIEKAQKIIDRIVFTCFAEDRGLLPDDTLRRVIRSADTSAFGGSLWATFKAFFEAIDAGSDKLEIPDGYNGGLFAHDAQLNNLKISDEALRSVANLSNYNFAEDLSVTILGHIFEQSISDLEEIKSKVNKSQNLETIKQSRRKKDGIFYTPDYIVRYIVENSLGAYLRKHEEEFKQEFGLKGDINDKNYERREKQTYSKYQEFLHNVKVVDPACGSGAFLVYVFDFLLMENERVASILGNSLFSVDDYVKSILQNNIYGVDLNEESVEITKLSLWLKTAQKGKKLTALDKNIKCGNSLIDDKSIVGVKAFNWRKEFTYVFESGGFDVVVGNPPYVKEYTSKGAFDGLRSDPVYQGKMDLWYFFGALALDILRPEAGIVGFIAPSNWTTNSGAQKFRNKVLSDGKLVEFADFGNFKVFDQAGIQTMVYIMLRSSNNSRYTFKYSKVIDSKIPHEGAASFLAKVKDERFVYFNCEINKYSSIHHNLNFNNQTIDTLLDKIKRSGTTYLGEDEVAQGIVAPQDYVNRSSQAIIGKSTKIGDGIFNLSLGEYANLSLNVSEKAIVKPFYTTEQLHRYFGDPHHQAWVIYTDSKFKNSTEIEPYQNIKAHLDKFASVITSDNKPYGLHRARDERFFTGEKIMSLRKCNRPTFTFTDFDCYVSQTYFIIKTGRIGLLYLTAILSSKLIAFWLKYHGKVQGDLYQIDKAPLLEIPIIATNNQKELSVLAEEMINSSGSLYKTSQQFQRLISSEFGLRRWPSGASRWWVLSFTDFISALKLQTSIQQKDELLTLFEKYRSECSELDEIIQHTDTQVDLLVYKLYNLTQEEIDVIEESVK